MSVSTIGVVATKTKNIALIAPLVSGALERIIINGRRKAFPDYPRGGTRSDALSAFRTPTIELNNDAEGFRVFFTFNGHRRTLSVHLYCDCDHVDIAPQTLSMSLGCSGLSVEFMKAILLALSPLGPTYLNENDSNDGSIALYEPRLKSLGELLAHKLIGPYEVEKRVERVLMGGENCIISPEFDASITQDDRKFVLENMDKEYPGVPKDGQIKARWDGLEDYFFGKMERKTPLYKEVFDLADLGSVYEEPKAPRSPAERRAKRKPATA